MAPLRDDQDDDIQTPTVLGYSDLAEDEASDADEPIRDDEDASNDVLDIDDAYEQVHGDSPKSDRDEY